MNANSLVNLASPRQPCQTGNPRGRPSAGLSIIEWKNGVQDVTDQEQTVVPASTMSVSTRV